MSHARALIVGLTGGIASGKSTVARMFQSLGVPVVDADEAARAVVEPGSPALAEIRSAFSDAVFTADGRLDRARLRRAVFEDPARRRRLEDILHPRIRAWMDARIDALDAPYVIRMVPLLVETGQHESVDQVLVVDLPTPLQRSRALARDGGEPATVDAIMAAQASREQRLAAAHQVIRNDGDRDALCARVRTLHEHYLDLAGRLRRDQR